MGPRKIGIQSDEASSIVISEQNIEYLLNADLNESPSILASSSAASASAAFTGNDSSAMDYHSFNLVSKDAPLKLKLKKRSEYKNHNDKLGKKTKNSEIVLPKGKLAGDGLAKNKPLSAWQKRKLQLTFDDIDIDLGDDDDNDDNDDNEYQNNTRFSDFEDFENKIPLEDDFIATGDEVSSKSGLLVSEKFASNDLVSEVEVRKYEETKENVKLKKDFNDEKNVEKKFDKKKSDKKKPDKKKFDKNFEKKNSNKQSLEKKSHDKSFDKSCIKKSSTSKASKPTKQPHEPLNKAGHEVNKKSSRKFEPKRKRASEEEENYENTYPQNNQKDFDIAEYIDAKLNLDSDVEPANEGNSFKSRMQKYSDHQNYHDTSLGNSVLNGNEKGHLKKQRDEKKERKPLSNVGAGTSREQSEDLDTTSSKKRMKDRKAKKQKEKEKAQTEAQAQAQAQAIVEAASKLNSNDLKINTNYNKEITKQNGSAITDILAKTESESQSNSERKKDKKKDRKRKEKPNVSDNENDTNALKKSQNNKRKKDKKLSRQNNFTNSSGAPDRSLREMQLSLQVFNYFNGTDQKLLTEKLDSPYILQVVLNANEKLNLLIQFLLEKRLNLKNKEFFLCLFDFLLQVISSRYTPLEIYQHDAKFKILKLEHSNSLFINKSHADDSNDVDNAINRINFDLFKYFGYIAIWIIYIVKYTNNIVRIENFPRRHLKKFMQHAALDDYSPHPWSEENLKLYGEAKFKTEYPFDKNIFVIILRLLDIKLD